MTREERIRLILADRWREVLADIPDWDERVVYAIAPGARVRAGEGPRSHDA